MDKNRGTRRLLALGLLLAGALAGAADLDSMIADLQGTDDTARARARQFLPREGVAALEKLIPLLRDERAEVSWVAYNVVSDIANEACGPAREAEREVAARTLMALVAPDQPDTVKAWGLELLAVVVPEGMDVRPVAALLQDPDTRERARGCLEVMNTAKGRAALRKALREADPEFQYALLNTLSRLEDPKSVKASLKLTNSDDPPVRAAAARALAWTADPSLEGTLRRVAAEADEATRVEATDALLRYADALAWAERYPTALAIYRDLLNGGTDTALRGAALAGLIRHGDVSVAEEVRAALDDPELRPMAVSGFESCEGERASSLLHALYPNLPPDLKAALLGAAGRKRDAAYFELLRTAAGDADPGVRRAALAGLGDSELAEAVTVLSAACSSADADERVAAALALDKLATACRERGDGEAAGRAYAALYAAAPTDELRQRAVEGAVQYPTAEALGFLERAAAQGNLPATSATGLADLAWKLKEAGRQEEATRAYRLVLGQATTAQGLREVARVAREVGGIDDVAGSLGFLTRWKLAGPFPWSDAEGFSKTHVGEPEVDTSATYYAGGETVAWRDFETKDDLGVVNLTEVYGARDNVTVYAWTTVEVPAATDAVIRAGSDDGIKVWVNGAPVHENLVLRGVEPDQDRAPVKLQAGKNTILVRLTQGAAGYGFCLRLTQPNGAPLEFTQAP